MPNYANSKVCNRCGIVVSDLRRHLKRNRCEAQHHRGGFYPTGAKGTGGKHEKKEMTLADKLKEKLNKKEEDLKQER